MTIVYGIICIYWLLIAISCIIMRLGRTEKGG